MVILRNEQSLEVQKMRRHVKKLKFNCTYYIHFASHRQVHAHHNRMIISIVMHLWTWSGRWWSNDVGLDCIALYFIRPELQSLKLIFIPSWRKTSSCLSAFDSNGRMPQVITEPSFITFHAIQGRGGMTEIMSRLLPTLLNFKKISEHLIKNIRMYIFRFSLDAWSQVA